MVTFCIRRGQGTEHPAELCFLIYLFLSIPKAFFEAVVDHLRPVGFFHRLDHQAKAAILSGLTDCKVIEGNIGIGGPIWAIPNKKTNSP